MKVLDIRERSHMTSAAEEGGGFEMLTVADRGRGGVKFAKILLTSYVNAPLTVLKTLFLPNLMKTLKEAKFSTGKLLRK